MSTNTLTTGRRRPQDHGTANTQSEPDWHGRISTQRFRDARDAAAWQAELHAINCTADLDLFGDDYGSEPIDYGALNELLLDAAAEAGDPNAIARQRELSLLREARLYPGLADLGLDPTRRLRRQNHVVDEPDPHDKLDALDYVGISANAQSNPYYL